MTTDEQALLVAILFFIGMVVFMRFRTARDCADAAISINPPDWWKKLLIDAEARKHKQDLEASR